MVEVGAMQTFRWERDFVAWWTEGDRMIAERIQRERVGRLLHALEVGGTELAKVLDSYLPQDGEK